MTSRRPAFTEADKADLRRRWTRGKRIADLADELGISEDQAKRRLRAAGLPTMGRGRPLGAKDSPWCDRQQNKRGTRRQRREEGCEDYTLATQDGWNKAKLAAE